MGNITTVFVRVVFHPRRMAEVPVRDLLHTFFDEEDRVRDFMWVPLWVVCDPHTARIDVTYGGDGGAPERKAYALEERFSSVVDRVFVRWNAEAMDLDYIRDAETGAEDVCWYRFDAIEAVPIQAKARSPAFAEPGVVEHAGAFRWDVTGRYLNSNSRFGWFGKESVQLEPSSEFAEIASLGPIDPPEIGAWVDACRRRADELRFYWRGRMVHREVRRGSLFDRGNQDSWMAFNADGWDNCADERYLAWAEGEHGSG